MTRPRRTRTKSWRLWDGGSRAFSAGELKGTAPQLRSRHSALLQDVAQLCRQYGGDQKTFDEVAFFNSIAEFTAEFKRTHKNLMLEVWRGEPGTGCGECAVSCPMLWGTRLYIDFSGASQTLPHCPHAAQRKLHNSGQFRAPSQGSTVSDVTLPTVGGNNIF